MTASSSRRARRLQLQHGLPLSILCLTLTCSQLQAQDAASSDAMDAMSESKVAQTAEQPNSDASNDSVEQARANFERGVEYYEDGDYRAAFIAFQRAYALQHAYQLLYNLGQVADELRDYAGAERYFRRYLADGEGQIPTERRSEVTDELARLKTRVGSLLLRTNLNGAEIRVDDRTVEHADGPIRVSAGRREVVAEKAGYLPVHRIVDVLGGEERAVELTFGPPVAQTGPAGSAGTAGPSNTLALITGISSAALLVGAGAVGYWAYTDSSAYSEQLDRFTTQSELDRLASNTRSKALVADILLGTALAAGVATVILVVTGGSREAHAAAETKPGIALGTSSVQLSF